MKKKITAILTVLLAALLLCGNASPVGLPEYEETEVRFDAGRNYGLSAHG